MSTDGPHPDNTANRVILELGHDRNFTYR
jgi:hypothetical protein